MRPLHLIAMFLLAFTPAASFADNLARTDALTIELRAMASDFAKIIEKNGGGAVAVGEFSASTDIKGSVGPRIQLTLAAELKALKITVGTERFRFEIKGDYQPLVDKTTKLLGVKLIGRLIDRETADVLAEKPTGRFIFGAETVPTIFGLTVPGRPTTDPRELSDRFREAYNNPHPRIHGTRVSASESSPYAIEVLVKSGAAYKARKVETDAKGRLIVPIDREEVYGVRLINNSEHQAAVDLRIDGLNCFVFSNTKSKYWILDKHSHVDVLGWHKSNEKTLEFQVVEFPETATAKLHLKPSRSIGLITVSFSAAWGNDARRPADEPEVTGRGTGFGAEIEVKTKSVTRTIGQVRDVISVRYER